MASSAPAGVDAGDGGSLYLCIPERRDRPDPMVDHVTDSTAVDGVKERRCYAYELRYLIILFGFGVLQGSARPSVPYITNSFFARRHGGGNCAETPDSNACRRGAIDASFYHGWFEASGNIVAVFFALALGSYSDRIGRRPIIRMFGTLTVLPMVALAGHIYFGLTLWAFLVMDSAVSAIDVNGVFLALMSDLIPNPAERAAAFGNFIGIIMCVGGVVFPCAFLLPQESTIAVSLLAGALKVVYLFCVFPETASPSLRGESAPAFGAVARQAFCVLTRHTFIFRMAMVLTISGLGGSGYAIVMSPFMEGYLGFTRKDKLILFLGVLASASLTFLFVMRPLVAAFGDVGVLRISLGAAVIVPILVPLCREVWHLCLLFAIMAGPMMLAIPVVSAIKSNLVRQNEQGLVQGAVASIGKATATGGFIFFGCLFRWVTHDGQLESRRAAMAPFMVIAFLSLLAVAIAFSLPKDLPKPLSEEAEDITELEQLRPPN